VRLFLDAHISARRIGGPLREQGHDVRSADEERQLDGLDDEQLLQIAAGEDRILLTFDVHDFPAIVQRWAEAGRTHAGCGIVVGIDHGEFGVVLATIERELAVRPRQAEWVDLTVFLARTSRPRAR